MTRAGRLGPLRKALEEQLFPVYTDRWTQCILQCHYLIVTQQWRGHQHQGVRGPRRCQMARSGCRGGPRDEGHCHCSQSKVSWTCCAPGQWPWQSEAATTADWQRLDTGELEGDSVGSSGKIHAEARQEHGLLHPGDFPHGKLYIGAKHIFCRKTYFLWQSLA